MMLSIFGQGAFSFFKALGLLATLWVATPQTLAYIPELKSANLTDPIALSEQANKVLVVFWATWCGICKTKITKVIPSWNLPPQIAVVAVNGDNTVARSEDFLRKNPFPPKVVVAYDPDRKVRKAQNVTAVPHWNVLERQNANTWVVKGAGKGFDESAVQKALGINSR